MRRSEREITSREEIDAIIGGCQVCRLAFALGNEPYIVPLSFGYDGTKLYFHTAPEGRKIEFIRGNNRVCFEMERETRLHHHEELACRWTCSYESVIGYGSILEITDPAEKVYALNRIMLHYSGREWSFPDAALERTRIWALRIETVGGKRSVR